MLGADYAQAMEACGEALLIAKRDQDSDLEIATLSQAAQVERFHLYPGLGLQKSLQVIELLRVADDPSAEDFVRGVAVGCSLVLGYLEGARTHGAALLALVERLGRQDSARAFWWNAEVSRLEGEWERAYEYTTRGLEVSPGDPRILV